MKYLKKFNESIISDMRKEQRDKLKDKISNILISKYPNLSDKILSRISMKLANDRLTNIGQVGLIRGIVSDMALDMKVDYDELLSEFDKYHIEILKKINVND